uniref:Poly [ADP-ribose] polymerase n=1 Tax=Ornithorhynchus anatinus TaxID=9258 RepID=F6TYG6_ORNAN
MWGSEVEVRALPLDLPDELLLLYFESRRRSGGGPLRGWRRRGPGATLSFRDPEAAARVLSRDDHVLQGVSLVLRPGAPRDPRRLLLQGLEPGTAPDLLELYVEALLGGGSSDPGGAFLPRPQLSPLVSPPEFDDLVARASRRPLAGAPVTVAWVPRPLAVRVQPLDGGTLDTELLELYFESTRRSGGGPLEGLRPLPGQQGIVVSFRHWDVAERVLQKSHRLQGSELGVTPHYDFLEPDDKDGAPESQESGPAEPENSDLEGRRVTRGQEAPRSPAVAGGPAPGSPAAMGPPGPVDALPLPGPPVSVGPKGTPESPAGALSELLTEPQPEPLPQEAPVGLAEAVVPEEPLEPAEVLVPMEPGALRYLQLHHQDLLTGLRDVVLCPLDASDVAGFRARACRAAEEFLQSLLGSVGCQTLPLTLPGSARFLLSTEGQTLLRDLEVCFQCAIGTERGLAATFLIPIPTLPGAPTPNFSTLPPRPALHPGQRPFPSPRSSSHPFLLPLVPLPPSPPVACPEEIKALLAVLEGPGEEEEEEEDGEAEDEAAERALAEARQQSLASFRREQNLDEEAALLLALQRSLEPQEREQEDLERALALSLLEVRGAERDPALGRLLVHVAFEQDLGELEAALEEALKAHLSQEVVVGVEPQALPEGLFARLERHYGVSVALSGDVATLRGFGPQPARAARRLAAHLGLDLPRALAQAPKGEVRLEPLEESGEEFQQITRDFYGSLDDVREIRVVKVERLLHPLLQRQYELQRQRLERLCPRRPVERTLYHGTSAQAVPEICLHGFSRNFCGLNAALYGQGVYFAVQAGLSVQDRYSPCDAQGHKAVFVARVLTGEYTAGKPGLRAPPLRRATGNAPLRYDSVVDCPRQPSIFVIFHDTRRCPAFLITCQRRPSPPSGPGRPEADPAS